MYALGLIFASTENDAQTESCVYDVNKNGKQRPLKLRFFRVQLFLSMIPHTLQGNGASRTGWAVFRTNPELDDNSSTSFFLLKPFAAFGEVSSILIKNSSKFFNFVSDYRVFVFVSAITFNHHNRYGSEGDRTRSVHKTHGAGDVIIDGSFVNELLTLNESIHYCAEMPFFIMTSLYEEMVSENMYKKRMNCVSFKS